tara:strand:- start:68 stop:514 length:447 start_codon:yes stop_codon:yes gene_type:complete
MASLADITPSPLPSITLGEKVYKFMPFSVRVKMHMEQVHSGIYQELARPDGINLVAYLKVAFFAIADKTDLTFEKFCKLVDKESLRPVKDNQPTILDQIMQAVATWLEADAKKIERLVKVKKKYREAIKTTLGLTIWSCLLYLASTVW